MPFCEKCGGEHGEGATFCRTCGAKLGTHACAIRPRGSWALPRMRWSKKLIVSVAACLLVIIAAGVTIGVVATRARGESKARLEYVTQLSTFVDERNAVIYAQNELALAMADPSEYALLALDHEALASTLSGIYSTSPPPVVLAAQDDYLLAMSDFYDAFTDYVENSPTPYWSDAMQGLALQEHELLIAWEQTVNQTMW
jgi:hypothetical protein